MTSKPIPAQRYLRNTRRPFDDPVNVARCLHLYRQGTKTSEIARTFDVPIYQVYREINRAGERITNDFHQRPLSSPPPSREPCPCCGVRADVGCGHTVRW